DWGGWDNVLWVSGLGGERDQIKAPENGAETEAYLEYDKATEDAKKRSGPPFAWCYVDPRNVYPQWSGGSLCEVLETSDMPLRSAFRKYRLARDSEGNIVPEELGQAQNPSE